MFDDDEDEDDSNMQSNICTWSDVWICGLAGQRNENKNELSVYDTAVVCVCASTR